MTLRPLAAILAALVLLAAPCALAQTPATAPAPATTETAPAPTTEVAPATTEAPAPATTEAVAPATETETAPGHAAAPAPSPEDPGRHLADDDHRHRPDRSPSPDRPRHPRDQEAGIGEGPATAAPGSRGGLMTRETYLFVPTFRVDETLAEDPRVPREGLDGPRLQDRRLRGGVARVHRPAARPLPQLGHRRAAPGVSAPARSTTAGRTATRSSPRRSPSSRPTT